MTQTAGHIVLIGFMGAGKTTVARIIARREHMMSLDMDTWITRDSGKTIASIFEQEGEAGFRARETELLKRLAGFERGVISCGGGVVATAENLGLLRALGTIVYLEVDVAEVTRRVSNPETRPLLANEQAAQRLLDERRALYEELADLRVNTNGLAASEVARRVTAGLRRMGAL